MEPRCLWSVGFPRDFPGNREIHIFLGYKQKDKTGKWIILGRHSEEGGQAGPGPGGILAADPIVGKRAPALRTGMGQQIRRRAGVPPPTLHILTCGSKDKGRFRVLSSPGQLPGLAAAAVTVLRPDRRYGPWPPPRRRPLPGLRCALGRSREGKETGRGCCRHR